MSITQNEFDKIIERLEMAVEPLVPEKGNPKRAGVYYERLKGQDFGVLWKAISILLDNYKYKRFPTIAEILDACADADRRIKWAIMKDAEREAGGSNYDPKSACLKCGGTGWTLIEYFEPLYQLDHEKAVNCSCAIGQARAAAWKADPSWESPNVTGNIYERIDES